jgi:hypothetical protein
MKKAGTAGTMDQLRARAYLHLLAGCTLLTPPPASSTPSGGGPPGNGPPRNGPPGNSTGVNAAASGEMGAPGPGLPALRGTVNLTMPLATWLGWTQSPGQVPGFGTLDADDSRALAALLAQEPGQQMVHHPHRPRRAPHRPRLRQARPPTRPQRWQRPQTRA